MLCEINTFGNIFVSYIVICLLTIVTTAILSGSAFYYYYSKPTYEKWTRKSNPLYPEVDKVRDEIIQTLKGIASAAICPAISMWMGSNGYNQAYCNVEPHGYLWLLIQFLIIWIGTDFCEFYYHRLGHTTNWGWVQHKYHHIFYNPTPWAVIADEYVDQFVRAVPLIIFPIIMPTNIDLMFITFTTFFYGYGV